MWDSAPPKSVRGTNKSIPRIKNTGRTDPGGLNKSIPHRANRSPGDQNSQASNTTVLLLYNYITIENAYNSKTRSRGDGQNGIGQNDTDKMARTKWHGQNGSNFYRFQFN